MSGSGQGIFRQLTKLLSATADSDAQVGLGIPSSFTKPSLSGHFLYMGRYLTFKKMKYLFIFCLILSIAGCDPKEESIDFFSSQPENNKISNSFNKNYQGTYKNQDDSTKLLIANDLIIKVINIPIAITKTDLDSTSSEYSQKELKEKLAKENIAVKDFKGDSIFGIWSIQDTIFSISDNNVLKFLKGSYFLNYTEDGISWKVQRMDLKKNRLSIGMIMPNDSLFKETKIKEKFEVENDSGSVINYQIKPSKKELKNLVKKNAFQEREVWIKEK